MKTITQEQMDNIKSKPVNEQVLFLLDLIDKGQEVLEVNKEIIEKNLQQVFVLTVMEIVTASMTIEQRFQLIYDLTFSDDETPDEDINRLRDFLSESKKELKAIQKAVYMNEKNISTANWDRLVIEDAIRIFKKTSER